MGINTAVSQLVVTILQGVGLLAIIVVIFGFLRKLQLDSLKQSLLLGAMFGLSILLLDVISYATMTGLHLNGRFMCVALAAAFGGLPALIVAAPLGALSQSWSTDLAGLANLFGPTLCGVVALIWRWKIRSLTRGPVSAMIVLGLMLSVPLVVLHVVSSDGAHPPLLLLSGGATIAAVLLTTMVGLSLERQKDSLLREQALLKASLRDSLTGLHNRRSFDAELARVLARPGSHYLLYVDIDHFKALNDRFGHVFGDVVLQKIAGAMSQSVRHDDIVARIGGEEFGIILPDISRDAAQALAERLLAVVSACNFDVAGERVAITVSIGAAHGQQVQTANALVGIADAALYEAKNLGRRCVVFSTDDPQASTCPAEPIVNLHIAEEKGI